MKSIAPTRPLARWVAPILVAVTLAVTLAACGAESTGPEDPGAAPPLPPLSSMAVDFSYFGTGGGPGAASSVAGQDAIGLHFTAAALRLFVAEVVGVAVLAVPTATFAAALQAQPEYENGVWHWRTSASAEGGSWSAHLSGTIQGPDAVWEMRITSPGSASPALDAFLWYSGVSKLDGSSGTWRIYDPNVGGSEVLRLDWTHAAEDEHSLTINVTGSGATAGDYITFTVDGTWRTVQYFDATDGTTVEIGWNAATGEGYIVTPGYNGGIKSCWNSAQNDVPCPA